MHRAAKPDYERAQARTHDPQMRFVSSRMIRMTTTTPATPLGPYPQLRLYPQVGSAPIKARMRMMRRIVPTLIDGLSSSPMMLRRNVRTPAWFHGAATSALALPRFRRARKRELRPCD